MGLQQRGGVFLWEQVIGGVRYRKSTGVPVGGAREKALAERRAGEFANQVRGGNFGYEKPKVPTLQEWWQTYDRVYEPLKGEGTQRRDRTTMRLHALPFFGTLRLDQITKSMCLDYLNRRREAVNADPRRKTPQVLAEGTIARERNLLQAIFRRAQDDWLIAANPWSGIKRHPVKVRERVLLEDEQTRLLAELPPTYQRFVRLLLGTGCRIGEVRGVVPAQHLNLETREMRVLGKGRKWRTVPLSEPVVEVIKAQLEDGGWWPQAERTLHKMLAVASRRAGIPPVHPHCLRHTFGHRWLAGGGDVFVLSRVLGHAGVVVTTRHYAHLLQEDLRAAMDARELGVMG